ncbi:kinase-like domain-containing protein [Neurospora crassa]|nr:kinase-like domain-containing protein [Neurospora crassa]
MQSLLRKARVKSSDMFRIAAIRIQIAGLSTSKPRAVQSTPSKPGFGARISSLCPLSEQQKKTIAKNPLGRTLDSVREKLRDSDEADETHRKYIADLLQALCGSSAGCEILIPDDGILRLLCMRMEVRDGKKTVNLDLLRPLVGVVVDDNTNDNAIWAAVLRLLDPRATISQTPVDINSSWGIQLPPLTNKDKDLWEEKIYNCLVSPPAGHVISRFRTVKQLLESMRDAIKAHRYLYLTSNILHRNISPNNIIIMNPKITNGLKGMLINLDMAAKVREDGQSPSRQPITDTLPFMAIEVLRNMDHTYRHDLESFFYVLLWVCARQSWSNGVSGKDEQTPDKSFLDRWGNGHLEHIALNKKHDMASRDLFEELMNQFPKSLDPVKPLCFRIRKILFAPYDRKGRMLLGTPEGNPDQLYRPIIEAYDEVIDRL